MFVLCIMNEFLTQLAAESGLPVELFLVVLIWSVIWKAIAFWKSARLNQPVWFIAFFLIHTIGILEILYVFLFSKMRLDEKPARKRKK